MAKKPVSVLVSRGQKKKKSIQHVGKRRKLKSALRKIFNYMKSDSYMFAPLIHPQSPPPVSSGEVSFEPMKKKEKKLVEEYLKRDDYMYAPLVTDCAYNEGTSTTTPSLGDGKVCDEMETAGVSRCRDVDRHNVVRRIVVEHHSRLHTERVKHIVQHNCRPLSATGEVLSPKKPRKVVVE